MQRQEFKEIEESVHNIARNLVLLSTNATEEQILMADRAMNTLNEFSHREYGDIGQLKKAFQNG